MTSASTAEPGSGGKPIKQQATFDPRSNDRLAACGYSVLPLLSPAEVDTVRRIHRRIAPEGDHGLTVDYMRPDRNAMRLIWSEVIPVVRDRLSDLLPQHRPVMATFVTKHPGVLSEMFLHEDRTFVDERRGRAVTAWIPLVDVGGGVPNGPLQIVPRSHLLDLGLSGSNTPDLIRPFERFLRSLLSPLEVPAGSAAIYDTRTIHASPPNLTDEPRVALVVAMAPRGEPLVHVRATGRRTRVIHRIDEAFFVDHHPREIEREMPSHYPIIDEVHQPKSLAPEDFAVLGVVPPDEPEPVVPPDIASRVSIDSWLEPCAVSLRSDGELGDLRIVDLSPDFGPPVAPVTPQLVIGEVRVAPVGRAFRAVGWEPSVWSSRRLDRSLRLVALMPGARIDLEPGSRRRVEVLDSPAVGAGLVVSGSFTSPQPGEAYEIPAGTAAVLWNDGPGEFVLVIAARRRPLRQRRARSGPLDSRYPRSDD